MVAGIRHVPDQVNIAEPRKISALRIYIDVLASYVQIGQRLSGYWYTAKRCQRAAISWINDVPRGVRNSAGDRFANLVRIPGSYRQDLVRVAEQRQMRTFAPNICSGKYNVTRQFFLNAEVPLLHVRPNGLVGNGS